VKQDVVAAVLHHRAEAWLQLIALINPLEIAAQDLNQAVQRCRRSAKEITGGKLVVMQEKT
jgi:hypothetical protein